MGDAELYAVKLTESGGGTTDWHYDLRAKGGLNVGGASISDFAYTILGGNFTISESPTDGLFVIVTNLGGAGELGCRVLLDSGNAANPNLGPSTFQSLGETIAPVFDGFMGTGISLQPPGVIEIPLDRGMGVEPVTYPLGYSSGIEIMFGAFIDAQPLVYQPMAGCTFGGAIEHPTNPGHGILHGYNIYRQRDDGSETPPAEWDEADWLGYIPHHSFVLETPTGDPIGDWATYVDSDDIPFNGNEYVRYNDTADGAYPRPSGHAAPSLGSVYWYAIQATVEGDHFEWNADTRIAGVPLGFDPVNGAAIDLDNDGSAEFISHNATVGGHRGLGLTCGGRIGPPGVPLAMRGQMNILSSTDNVTLTAATAGRLSLAVDFESAEVLGYDLFRLSGRSRTRINERLVLARGGQGVVHRLVDAELARLGRARYEVEVHRVDGSHEVEGPFQLELTRRGSSRRR